MSDIAYYDERLACPETDIKSYGKQFFINAVKRFGSSLSSGPNPAFRNAKVKIDNASLATYNRSPRANVVIKDAMLQIMTPRAQYYTVCGLVLAVTQNVKKRYGECLVEYYQSILGDLTKLNINLKNASTASAEHIGDVLNESIAYYHDYVDKISNSIEVQNIKTGQRAYATPDNWAYCQRNNPDIIVNNYQVNCSDEDFKHYFEFDFAVASTGILNALEDLSPFPSLKESDLFGNFERQRQCREIISQFIDIAKQIAASSEHPYSQAERNWAAASNWGPVNVHVVTGLKDSVFGQVINMQTNQPVDQRTQKYVADVWKHALSN